MLGAPLSTAGIYCNSKATKGDAANVNKLASSEVSICIWPAII